MYKWEYQVVEYESQLSDLSACLNQQGEQGWEFVSILMPGAITTEHPSMREALSRTPASLQLIFKRQI